MKTSDLKNEVTFIAVRSRGPGGQNVNKVSSAAILYWNFIESNLITDQQKILIQEKLHNVINKDDQLHVRSDEFRDLERNKMRCLEKLLELLTFAFHKPKKRRATKPTHSSKMRKRESKNRRSEIKKMRRREW